MKHEKRWTTIAAAAAMLTAASPAWAAGASGTAAAAPGANGAPGGQGGDSAGTLGTEVPPSSRATQLAYDVTPRPSPRLREGLAKLHADEQGDVQEAQLAAQHSSDPGVKQLAWQIAASGERDDETLIALAHDAGMRLDGLAYQTRRSSEEQALGAVQAKTGIAFDRAFLSNMERDGRLDRARSTKLSNEARLEGKEDLANFLDRSARDDSAWLADASRDVLDTGTGAGPMP